MKAVILAAGRGERLGELGEHTPKAMLRVGGSLLIERSLRWLAAQGIGEVAITVSWLADQVRAHVGDGASFGVKVRWSHEASPLGTAGALVPLREWLRDGPFVVVHGDCVVDFDLVKLTAAHAGNAAVATLALSPLRFDAGPEPDGNRVEMDRAGRVLRYGEGRRDATLRYLHAGGTVFEPSLLEHLPVGVSDFGRDVIPLVCRHQGLIAGHLIDGSCIDLDSLEALKQAQRSYGENVTG